VSSDTPKTAVELAMEKLARQDESEGTESRSLTEEQKTAIAEARRICEARTAECRILHEASVLSMLEPEARRDLDINYQRDLARLVNDRDRKIQEILQREDDDHAR
tara:strand:- start:264 stop:581 length:318 start_codon:yes stop_codon:yes gene_type:complete